MKASNINPVITQDLHHNPPQMPYNAIPDIWMASRGIKCVTPMIYSQKLYKFKEIEIAEEFEQAIDANSLEQINNLLNKLVEAGKGK